MQTVSTICIISIANLIRTIIGDLKHKDKLLTQTSSHHFSHIWQYIQVDIAIYSTNTEKDIF